MTVFISVEDCLWPGRGKKVLNDFYYGLIELKDLAKKLNIIFCTGGDQNYIEAVAAALGFTDNYSIIENGAAIFCSASGNIVLNPRITKVSQEVFEEVSRKAVPEISDKYNLSFWRGVFCVRIVGKRTLFFKIKKALEKYDPWLNFSVTDNSIDITPKGINKASGVNLRAELSAENLKQSIGIGSSEQDMSWLEMIGKIGCPANADDKCKNYIKKRRGYISSSSYSAGVTDIIKNLSRED